MWPCVLQAVEQASVVPAMFNDVYSRISVSTAPPRLEQCLFSSVVCVLGSLSCVMQWLAVMQRLAVLCHAVAGCHAEAGCPV